MISTQRCIGQELLQIFTHTHTHTRRERGGVVGQLMSFNREREGEGSRGIDVVPQIEREGGQLMSFL